MFNNDFSVREQEDTLSALIYYNATDLDWNCFNLSTEKIIHIICGLNDKEKIIYYLDSYALHIFENIDYEDQFKLVKKRIEYFCNLPLDSRYHLGGFKVEDKEELLKIAIKNSIQDCKVYILNLSFFNLPFMNTIGIVMQYPVIFTSILNYLNQFTSSAFYLKKKNIILQLLSITDRNLRQEDCMFMKEDDRVEILNILAKNNPTQVINNIKNFQITDPFVRLKILINVMDNLQEPHDFIENVFNFELTEIPGIIGRISVKLQDFFVEETNLDFDLIYAELIKCKIFNNNFIWENDDNQFIFEKEFNFLKKYDIIDEVSGHKFLIITNWLIYTLILSNALEISCVLKNHINIVQKVFKEIRSFPDSKMRFLLSKLMLMKICNDSTIYNLYFDFVEKKGQTFLLPSLILVSYVPWIEISHYKTLINDIVYKIHKNNKKYKDGKHMRSLIFGLQSVFSTSKLNYEAKLLLINKMLSYDIIEQKNCWWLIQSMLDLHSDNLEELDKLYQIIMQDNIKCIFKTIFMHVFKVDNHDLINNYEKSFGSKHNQAALLIYYTKMKLLPENQQNIMLEVLSKYFNSVLSNNSIEYYFLRYDINCNSQLKLIFEYYPELKLKWQEGYVGSYEKFIRDNELTDKKNKEFDLIKFLTSRVIKYKHLPLYYSEHFQKYVELHEAPQVDESKKSEIEIKLQQQINLTLEGHIIDPDVISYKLQLALINVIKLNPKDLQKQFACLMEINRYIPANINVEFSADLYYAARRLIRKSVYKYINYSRWKIVDTDNYWSMFMGGTDIEGSCLRVDGNPNLNKYLMGNVINGDCRMLAIQNEEGVTIARCIIRLLWDAIDKIACLFLEEIYPYYINDIQEQVLYKLAIKRAAYLNLILVNLEGNIELVNYNNPLIRIEGGHAPFVYSDANHGVEEQINSKIKVINAKILFNYAKEKLNKEQELYEAIVKYKVDIYQKGIFFTPSKHATYKYPYGPYSDYYCCLEDPLVNVTQEYTKLLKLRLN